MGSKKSRNGLPKCGAKTRRGTPCKLAAGFKTDHVGEGKCYLHGGESTGAPEGNRNAVTTGAYESIHLDQLDDEERHLFVAVDVTPRVQVEEEIRLLSIRERRMLARIHSIVEDLDTLTPVEELAVGGWSGGKIQTLATKSEHVIERVQRIEQALTRVQAQKTRAIEQLRRILAEPQEDTDDPLGDLARAIRESRKLRDNSKVG